MSRRDQLGDFTPQEQRVLRLLLSKFEDEDWAALAEQLPWATPEHFAPLLARRLVHESDPAAIVPRCMAPLDGEGHAIHCPYCRYPYSHIARVYTRTSPGADESGRKPYAGTTELRLGPTGWRRDALVIEFDGECRHRWALVIQQHKGTDLLFIEQLAANEVGDEA